MFSPQDWIVAFALFTGIVFVRSALSVSAPSRRDDIPLDRGEEPGQVRVQRADDERERKGALPRYAVALVAFSLAGALLAHLISPVVAYAILCVSVVGRAVADQIAEERAPRRRSTVIGRVRGIDPILLIWMALAGAASLGLIPWLFDERYRAVAAVVALCVLAMLGIAWRIASAPPLLFGTDIEAEEVVDRETRAIRTGNASAIALAPVFVFMSFVGEDPRFALAVLFTLVAILAWKSIYSRHLSRIPLAS